MMMDTIVPNSRKKEKARRVTVELYEEGQHPDKRHGAEPHRQDAQLASEHKAIHAPMMTEKTPKLKQKHGSQSFHLILVLMNNSKK